MHSAFLKKFMSLFLIVMILTASGLCLCQETHATEQSPAVSADTGSDTGSGHCPACPGDNTTDSDQCDSSCNCSCHLPLTVQTLQIQHSPVITDLVFFESFTAMPEVYLPKFIPPQNLA